MMEKDTSETDSRVVIESKTDFEMTESINILSDEIIHFENYTVSYLQYQMSLSYQIIKAQGGYNVMRLYKMREKH